MNIEEFDETTQIPSGSDRPATGTYSDEQMTDEATVLENRQVPSAAQNMKKFGTIAGGGVILGSLSALLAGFAPSREPIAQADEPSPAENNAEDGPSDALVELNVGAEAFAEVELPEIVVTAPAVVNDDMPFEEAFDNARSEVGPGGAFAWHGDLYSTYTPQEWTDLSEDQRVDLIDQLHLTETADSTDILPETAAEATAEIPAEPSRPETVSTPPFVAQVPEHTVADDDDIEILSAVPDRPETGIVEILGVSQTVIADGPSETVEGQEVLVIDVDGDMVYDYMALDTDGDGVINPDEIIDIHQQGLSQEDLAALTHQQPGDMTATIDGSLLSSDGPDYMADVINEG